MAIDPYYGFNSSSTSKQSVQTASSNSAKSLVAIQREEQSRAKAGETITAHRDSSGNVIIETLKPATNERAGYSSFQGYAPYSQLEPNVSLASGGVGYASPPTIQQQNYTPIPRETIEAYNAQVQQRNQMEQQRYNAQANAYAIQQLEAQQQQNRLGWSIYKPQQQSLDQKLFPYGFNNAIRAGGAFIQGLVKPNFGTGYGQLLEKDLPQSRLIEVAGNPRYGVGNLAAGGRKIIIGGGYGFDVLAEAGKTIIDPQTKQIRLAPEFLISAGAATGLGLVGYAKTLLSGNPKDIAEASNLGAGFGAVTGATGIIYKNVGIKAIDYSGYKGVKGFAGPIEKPLIGIEGREIKLGTPILKVVPEVPKNVGTPFKTAEVQILEKTMKARTPPEEFATIYETQKSILPAVQNVKSAFTMDTFKLDIERINPAANKALEVLIRQREGALGGSVSQKFQTGPNFEAPREALGYPTKPQDVDVYFQTKAQAEAFAKDALALMKRTGEPLTIIESSKESIQVSKQFESGKYGHIIDIHWFEIPKGIGGGVSNEGLGYGFAELPLITKDSLKFKALPEQAARKAIQVLTPREKGFAPAEHRIKDIADTISSEFTLIQSMKKSKLLNIPIIGERYKGKIRFLEKQLELFTFGAESKFGKIPEGLGNRIVYSSSGGSYFKVTPPKYDLFFRPSEYSKTSGSKPSNYSYALNKYIPNYKQVYPSFNTPSKATSNYVQIKPLLPYNLITSPTTSSRPNFAYNPPSAKLGSPYIPPSAYLSPAITKAPARITYPSPYTLKSDYTGVPKWASGILPNKPEQPKVNYFSTGIFSSVKAVKGFIPEIRRKGKFVALSSIPLSYNKAFQLGSNIATTTLAATFRLKPSGLTMDEDAGSLSNLQEKFYSKVDKKAGEVFIQYPRYRLSTSPEVFEIQAAKKAKQKSSFLGF